MDNVSHSVWWLSSKTQTYDRMENDGKNHIEHHSDLKKNAFLAVKRIYHKGQNETMFYSFILALQLSSKLCAIK